MAAPSEARTASPSNQGRGPLLEKTTIFKSSFEPQLEVVPIKDVSLIELKPPANQARD
jgi:hypothetical protein